MPFVMCTNEKKPHLWCENTVSYHGVDLARLKKLLIRMLTLYSSPIIFL